MFLRVIQYPEVPLWMHKADAADVKAKFRKDGEFQSTLVYSPDRNCRGGGG